MTHIPGAPRDTTRAAFLGGSGAGSGGSTVQTSTQSATPYNAAQLQDVFAKAKDQFGDGSGYSFYPNSTVVPFSNQTEAALLGTENKANAASPLLGAANTNLTATLNGDFLSAGNPNFSAMVDRISNEVRPRVDSQFAAAGRYGGGAHANASASALADATSSLAFQNYDQERTRQMQGQALAPQTYGAQFLPEQMLASVGAAREGKAAEDLGDQIQRFNFSQAAPDEALRRYASLVAGGSYGGQTVTQTPMYRNQGASLLGGALSGAALGQMTGLGAGYGAAGGALLGLI
ncbi:MAG: hypothetical protein J0H39_13985 [Alphaproteobacteria bacterium]|nr:hypothetical protein [Alphaproteobacteria bacterium]